MFIAGCKEQGYTCPNAAIAQALFFIMNLEAKGKWEAQAVSKLERRQVVSVPGVGTVFCSTWRNSEVKLFEL